ncbi:hypothetical protein FKW77_007220 [Venturia effusa]|uniref:Uncharacterized protein n=1 Tax=Venturia effusa TaxID=50376 RepID=A0A517LHI7_9PEZI|nr:hypothetical protein FKW77_007220 [Venturia effusa]
MFGSLSSIKLLAIGLVAQYSFAQDNPCKSFGVDFQDGGSYYQNSNSSDPFTFVSKYEGCQTDQADNIFVDPTGNQYECSQTTLTPDDAPMMATCPQNKNQLFSGAWSVVIISNNGAAAPIAYQRDFSLSVAPQVTATYTPSVTVPVLYTPVVNSTVSVTYTTNTTLAALTTTVPASTVIPTKTVIPTAVTTTSTKNLFTISLVLPTASVLKVTNIATASCFVPPFRPIFDRKASITPTVGQISASALASTSSAAPLATGAKFRVKDRRLAFNSEADRLAWLQEREERFVGGLFKRAPDNQTVTITDTNTAHYPTITTTSTLPALTATITSTSVFTATITPAPIKVLGPATTLQGVTITASTPTRTIVKYAVATNISTKTLTITVVINTKTTPAAVATSCKAAGGILY